MKHLSFPLAILVLASCAQTTVPAAVTVPGQDRFSHIPLALGTYHLEALETPAALITRYKKGHESTRRHRGAHEHALGLERTYRYSVPDALERSALLSALKADTDVEYVEPDYKLHMNQTPTDPYYAQQWDLPTIGLPQARDLTQGANTIVASIDSGVDYNHPDLVGQVIKGWNYVAGNADPMDDNGHGTHTAGTMAALTNNGAGVAGIAGAAKVLAIKALDSTGSGNTSDIANGITYAAQHGASVINLSLGGPSDSQTLHNAVQQAVSLGVLVVVAAGNDGTSSLSYPAAYPESLAVGATDAHDARATFSNYGPWVAIAAPGTNILSTYKGSYAYMQGTSMAAPHVSGVAALVRAIHPTWSVSQVRQSLVSTGDPCTGFESNPALHRLNAYKALQVTTTSATASPTPMPTATPTPASTPTPATPAPTASPVTNTTLSISSVYTTNITSNQSTFRWSTNVPADSQIQLVNLGWTSRAYGPFATTHALTVSGLSPSTWYAYKVISHDAYGRVASSAQRWMQTSAY